MTGYTTSTNNRLTNDGTYSYEYDNEGNRTRRTKTSTGEKTEYTWDYRNRLTQVVEKTSGGTITKQIDYKYDVFDRRLEKAIDADGAGAGTATYQRYVYDGDHIAMEFNGSGASNLTHRCLHGPVVDQILADEAVSSLTSAGTVRWPLADNQGTVRDIIDSAASVLNHIKYDSFGKVTSEPNGAVDCLFGYTARERDEESGLSYYRARYYDNAVGAFLSEDPIGFASSDTNLKRYVKNDPVNHTDPSGLEGQPSTVTIPVPGGSTTYDVIAGPGFAPIGHLISNFDEVPVFITDDTAELDHLGLWALLPNIMVDYDFYKGIPSWGALRDKLLPYSTASVDALIISGHGGQGGAASSAGGLIASLMTESTADVIRSRLDEDAVIFMLACGCGMDATEMQQLADELDHVIIANTGNINFGYKGTGHWIIIRPKKK